MNRNQLLLALPLLLAPVEAHAQTRLPIIDMHLHASSPDGYVGPQTVCTNLDRVEFPPIDPREEATVQKAATCAHPVMSIRDGEENARRTGGMVEQYNIYGVLDASVDGGLEASLAHGKEWSRHAPGRYWIAVDFSHAGLPPVDRLEAQVREGRIQVFAEISPQYEGKRLLFGSDQMIWPDTIPIAIETIEKAPFLTEEQKRDILYNNAARFLRLSEEEIARHHHGVRQPFSANDSLSSGGYLETAKESPDRPR